MDEKQALEQHTVDIMHDTLNRIMSRISPIIDTELRKSDLTAKDKAIIIRCIRSKLEYIENYYVGIVIMQENKEALTADKAESNKNKGR